MNKEQSFHNRSVYNITVANLRWLRPFMAKHLAKKYYLSFLKFLCRLPREILPILLQLTLTVLTIVTFRF